MFDDLVDALVDAFSNPEVAAGLVETTAGATSELEFLEALTDESFLGQLSDEEAEVLLGELDQHSQALASDSGSPLFGMSSSEATAVDISDMIEARDGTHYPTVSDFVSGTNGYEPLDE
jgi:hypothetical protein